MSFRTLTELFFDLVRLAVPDVREEDKDQLDAVDFRAYVGFSEIGAALDLPRPGPEEIISIEAAGFTRVE